MKSMQNDVGKYTGTYTYDYNMKGEEQRLKNKIQFDSSWSVFKCMAFVYVCVCVCFSSTENVMQIHIFSYFLFIFFSLIFNFYFYCRFKNLWMAGHFLSRPLRLYEEIHFWRWVFLLDFYKFSLILSRFSTTATIIQFTLTKFGHPERKTTCTIQNIETIQFFFQFFISEK